MQDALAFDQAGPVAILVLVLLALGKFTHGLITRVLADKDKQIATLSNTLDDLTSEIAETLEAVLSTVKNEAEERRRGRK